MLSFEDNWNDILHKAVKGLALDSIEIAARSGVPLQEVNNLLSGHLNKKFLSAIAPALSLNAAALLQLAAATAPPSSLLPLQMLQLTTSHHGMEVHSYLLWNEEEKSAVAFDTGADLTELLDVLSQRQLRLRSLFLTHGHADHVGKLQELVQWTHAQAWMSQADLVPGAKPLRANHLFDLGKHITIEARLTPGHSPGGMTYVIKGLSLPVAIVGDAIFASSVGGIPATAYSAALRAIKENILSLPEETLLCPGHGPLTTVGEELRWNPFF